MAARLRKSHQDDVRTKIQTSQLLNRLQDHAFGKIALTATQQRAIETLLRKTLPDLSQVQAEVSGPGGDALTIQVIRFGAQSGDDPTSK